MASVGSHLGGEWAYYDLIHIYVVRLGRGSLDDMAVFAAVSHSKNRVYGHGVWRTHKV
jgi:hypothetical protein